MIQHAAAWVRTLILLISLFKSTAISFNVRPSSSMVSMAVKECASAGVSLNSVFSTTQVLKGLGKLHH